MKHPLELNYSELLYPSNALEERDEYFGYDNDDFNDNFFDYDFPKGYRSRKVRNILREYERPFYAISGV